MINPEIYLVAFIYPSILVSIHIQLPFVHVLLVSMLIHVMFASSISRTIHVIKTL